MHGSFTLVTIDKEYLVVHTSNHIYGAVMSDRPTTYSSPNGFIRRFRALERRKMGSNNKSV